MDKQKNKRSLVYGVAAIITLFVAILGATFAYFTAVATNNNVITGNMATIKFGLEVKKVTHADETRGGMIPMSNNMIHAAVLNTTGEGVCVDNNGNAVCQVYKVEVDNTGTASLFLDGYISLTGGSGTPTDVEASAWKNITDVTLRTTMRWAQIFCTASGETVSSCSTVGKTTTRAEEAKSPASATASGITEDWATLDAKDSATGESYGHNVANIKTKFSDVTVKAAISGNNYDVINRNYIRISDHVAGEDYDRQADVTSALVFNQFLDSSTTVGGTSKVTYYFVVWLNETGTNQTPEKTPNNSTIANPSALKFFGGEVRFNSAQGSEVTATFTGFASVPSDQL